MDYFNSNYRIRIDTSGKVYIDARNAVYFPNLRNSSGDHDTNIDGNMQFGY